MIQWINHCCIDNNYVGIIGDDKMARIFNIESLELVIELDLQSPGVSIEFHPNLPGQIMTFEMNGTITIWDMDSLQRLKSLQVGSRLVCGSWNPNDPNTVGGIVGDNWFIATGDEIIAQGLCSMGAKFKWSENQSKMFAIGSNQVKVYPNHFTSGIILIILVPFVITKPTNIRDFCFGTNEMLLCCGQSIYKETIE